MRDYQGVMARPQSTRRSLCRAFVSVAAAYALALQALLFAFSGAVHAGAHLPIDHAALCAADASSPSEPDRGPPHHGGACCLSAGSVWGPIPRAGAATSNKRAWQVPTAVRRALEPQLDLASLIRPLGSRAPPAA
jgi:hypothetical protein